MSSGSTRRPQLASGNAGMIFIKCKTADVMAALCKKIDDLYRNSDYPDPNPDRGSVRQDVRGDAGRLAGDDPDHRPGRRLLAALRRGQLDGHVDARADQRGGRPQGDRLQQGADPLPGPDRVGPGRRASAARSARWDARPCAMSSTSRSTRPASCRSSTSPGTSRFRAWPSRCSSGSPAASFRPCGRPTSRSSTACGGSSEPP